jgi:hypothetical protein
VYSKVDDWNTGRLTAPQMRLSGSPAWISRVSMRWFLLAMATPLMIKKVENRRLIFILPLWRRRLRIER